MARDTRVFYLFESRKWSLSGVLKWLMSEHLNQAIKQLIIKLSNVTACWNNETWNFNLFVMVRISGDSIKVKNLMYKMLKPCILYMYTCNTVYW